MFFVSVFPVAALARPGGPWRPSKNSFGPSINGHPVDGRVRGGSLSSGQGHREGFHIVAATNLETGNRSVPTKKGWTGSSLIGLGLPHAGNIRFTFFARRWIPNRRSTRGNLSSKSVVTDANRQNEIRLQPGRSPPSAGLRFFFYSFCLNLNRYPRKEL